MQVIALNFSTELASSYKLGRAVVAMEQATRGRAHLERIQLVCGEQNAGKSRLLRHMLGDDRLGAEVAVSARVGMRKLSRERSLAIRFTSPHEYGDTPTTFHRKIERVREIAWRVGWRVNFACAVQPRAMRNMPGIVEVCSGLIREFLPERIRVVQLAPNQFGLDTSKLTSAEIDGLRALDIEVIAIDARRSKELAEPGNVRILADFFDFS